jgi:hypothetical protein
VGGDIVKIHERQEKSRVLAIIGSLIAAAVVGFLILVLYLMVASPLFPECGAPSGLLGGDYSGGAAAGGSELTAAILGGVLLFVAAIAAAKRQRRLAFVFIGFAGFYVIGLIVLWNVSPLIWGPRVCI